jgi:hypothetical protein
MTTGRRLSQFLILRDGNLDGYWWDGAAVSVLLRCGVEAGVAVTDVSVK